MRFNIVIGQLQIRYVAFVLHSAMSLYCLDIQDLDKLHCQCVMNIYDRIRICIMI